VAIAKVSSTYALGTSGAGSSALTLTVAVTDVGNIAFGHATERTSASASITFNSSAGTVIASGVGGSSAAGKVAYHVMGATGTINVVFNSMSTAQGKVAGAAVYSGVNTVAPLGASAVSTGVSASGATINATITSSRSDALLLHFLSGFLTAPAGAPTSGPGTTVVYAGSTAANEWKIALVEKTASASGSTQVGIVMPAVSGHYFSLGVPLIPSSAVFSGGLNLLGLW
jgi:hypothetical protein